MMLLRRATIVILALVLLGGAAAIVAARSPAAIAYLVERQVSARLSQPLDKTELFDAKALRVILCGTSSPLPDPNRAKSCTLVIAGGRVFVVDTGPESWKVLALMGIPGERVAGIFLTHFHSDHFGDLGEFRFQTWAAGRKHPLPVFGGPGVERITAGINEAYALDDGYRAAHHGRDITPIEAAPLLARPFHVGMSTARDEAEVILDSDGLKITAFDVNHPPIKPAVGYRFDYQGRSVVISGDTTKWRNVVTNAKGADVLVHEAQSQRMRQIIADVALQQGNPVIAKIFSDIENYHASPVDAAEVANQAGVRLLVLTHFSPPLPTSWLNPLYFEGMSARRPDAAWVAGFDGLRIDLPVGRSEIIQSKMPMGIFR